MTNSWKSVCQVFMPHFFCLLFDVFEFRRVKKEDVGDSARNLKPCHPLYTEIYPGGKGLLWAQ